MKLYFNYRLRLYSKLDYSDKVESWLIGKTVYKTFKITNQHKYYLIK